MRLGAQRPRAQLRHSLDRDVYQIVKKLEEANDGKPFKNEAAIYDAIKKSNSSLSRQKKRTLEDSIERVWQVRKEELGDSEDSEADLEEPEPKKPEDDRFLLNRQMTKHWNVQPSPQESSEPRPAKKRRLRNGDENDDQATAGDSTGPGTPAANGVLPLEVPTVEKLNKETQKKTLKSSRFLVENFSELPALGGLGAVRDELLQQTRYILKCPSLYMENNWRRRPGIILSGPPGVGKRSLIRSLAAELGVPLVSLAGCFNDPDRIEKSLHEAFDEAMRLAPSIIFIEHLDWYIAKQGSSGHAEHNRRALVEFTKQMERVQQSQPVEKFVLAMATTSHLTEVDPVVLKTGLLESTVELSIPDLKARQDILSVLTKDIDLADNVSLEELSKLTHGFVGADMVRMMTTAQQLATKRYVGANPALELMLEAGTSTTNCSNAESPYIGQSALAPPPKFAMEFKDFEMAIKGFVPSLRKEGFTSIPDITWERVGALEKARKQLRMSIIGPIKDPETYQKFGLVLPAGVLLWGPPGCGKTLVAQAVANEAKASLIVINGPELLNKYVGESERAVRELFQRARSSKPCILFFDEIDAIVPSRGSTTTDSGTRVVNALLTELDGARDRSGIYVIGTTNRPDMIDPAILRPGRLNTRIFIDLPTPTERVDILRTIYRARVSKETAQAEFDLLERIARDPRCDNFSGADLSGLQTKASESALERFYSGEKEIPEVDEKDWEYALSNTLPSVMDHERYRRLDLKLRGVKK